jgi:predicted nucleic acid-binding protein
VADALQIVTARARACDHFVTRDDDLGAAAGAEGLAALDPVRDLARIRQLV